MIWWIENVDKVVDAVEEVAEMVETAAEGVEKVAEEVAEHLPQGGQLQKAALFVENAAKTLSKDAHVAEQIVHKVFFFFRNYFLLFSYLINN